MKRFKLKTWHIETAVVSVILIVTTWLFANNLVNWLTVLAVLLTFQHGQIADRLQERQKLMEHPDVECYWKLSRYFVAKEIVWITTFLLMRNYAAIVGSVLFALYPLWRKYYRAKIKPIVKNGTQRSSDADRYAPMSGS